jgi:hypothetical protein
MRRSAATRSTACAWPSARAAARPSPTTASSPASAATPTCCAARDRPHPPDPRAPRLHPQPIVGDPVYGGRLALPKGAGPALIEALRGFRRQALHAARLELEHPASGELVRFEAPLPADFQALLAALRADVEAEPGAGHGADRPSGGRADPWA